MMVEVMAILNSNQILSFSTCINHRLHGIGSGSRLLIYCKRVLGKVMNVNSQTKYI